MKKPNITEGPWFSAAYGNYCIIQDEADDSGLNVFDGQHFPNAKNNAKAASAVPDMIDALIEARQEIITMDNCLAMNHQKYEIEALDRIEAALKKAGVIDL